MKKEDSDQEIKIAKQLDVYNKFKERATKQEAETLEEIKTLKGANRLKDAAKLEKDIELLKQEERYYDSSVESTNKNAKISADENKKKLSDVKNIAIGCILSSVISIILYAILFYNRNADHDKNSVLFFSIFNIIPI